MLGRVAMCVTSFDNLEKDRFQVLLGSPEFEHRGLPIVQNEPQQLSFGSFGVGHLHLERGCAARTMVEGWLIDDGSHPWLAGDAPARRIAVTAHGQGVL